MSNRRVALVTGVAGYWGGRVAAELLKQPDLAVIGLDRAAPDTEIEGLDFVQARPGNPALADLFAAEQVHVVCHLDFVESDEPSETTFERNVMDSMKLFGACVEGGVQSIVLKSSTMVYGALPENSAFLREAHPLNAGKRYGYLRDLLELESFCQSFQQQSPQTGLTILRFGHIAGAQANSPFMRFLREERSIVLLGFDPILQVIHEDDVVAALVKAVVDGARGVFNVAAEPLMPLWRIMGLAGKLPMPVLHPLAQLIVSALGTRYAPLDLDYLRYRCVGDLAQMQTAFGFVPSNTADQAIRSISTRQSLPPPAVEAGDLELEATQLRDTIERRRAGRQPAGRAPGGAKRPGKVAARKARALGGRNGKVKADEEASNG